VFIGKKALLLDMNGTFMFGEDRFGDLEDFSVYYYEIGGTLPPYQINQLIRTIYEYLDVRYTVEEYRHCFPTVESAIIDVFGRTLDKDEINIIVETFAYHELGIIPKEYTAALHRLHQNYILAAVIDIWSPKKPWLDSFERAGITSLFSTMSFSSDHGIVKPSPIPYETILNELEISNTEAIVVGDSPRRDLGGALNAGIDCILVGGAEHPDALCCIDNLLGLCELAKSNLNGY
jgi:FMN phosphatase YigB (HAD superfamily)